MIAQTTKLVCDQCALVAKVGQNFLSLQVVQLTAHDFVSSYSDARHVHACSTACAARLLERFTSGRYALPAEVLGPGVVEP